MLKERHTVLTGNGGDIAEVAGAYLVMRFEPRADFGAKLFHNFPKEVQVFLDLHQRTFCHKKLENRLGLFRRNAQFAEKLSVVRRHKDILTMGLKQGILQGLLIVRQRYRMAGEAQRFTIGGQFAPADKLFQNMMGQLGRHITPHACKDYALSHTGLERILLMEGLHRFQRLGRQYFQSRSSYPALRVLVPAEGKATARHGLKLFLQRLGRDISEQGKFSQRYAKPPCQFELNSDTASVLGFRQSQKAGLHLWAYLVTARRGIQRIEDRATGHGTQGRK